MPETTRITVTRPAPPWSSKDKDIYQLMKFQENEEKLSQENYDKNFSLPIEIRVSKGIALTNLSIQKLENSKKFRLICNNENNSKFRVGDFVKIHAGIKFDSNTIEGIILKEGDDFYDIEIFKGTFYYYFNNNVPIIMDYNFLYFIDKIIEKALKNLEISNKRKQILNIINGKASVIKDRDENSKLQKQNFYDGFNKKGLITLDKSQRKAFISAIINSPLSLIQGPPGTGKTTLLAFLCNYLASQGKNILLTGFTHRSINNALKAIWDSSDMKENVVKISDETKTTEFNDIYSAISVYKRFDQYRFFNTQGLIVGATPYEVTRDEFNRMNFDYVIFDEASQLHVNLAIMGMLRGEKYVFFGDHMQMKPIILGNSDDHLLYKKKIFNRSIFEFLFDMYNGTTLEICYRMNPKLISFSSKQFYKGKVNTPPENKDKILKLSSNPSKHKDILNPINIDVVVKVNHSEDSNKSKIEAILIGELVEELLKCGVSPTEIGIIAPYRPQLTLIKRELRKIEADTDNIIVETIERIQGQERDVIIFSLTRSNLDASIEDLEFFFTPNRLNVAITRAKKKRIVIGAESLFYKKKFNKTIDNKIKCFAQFLNNANEIFTYNS